MSPEEKEELIALAAERVLLMIPQVIGNMLQEIAAQRKLTEKFYADNPAFKDHMNVVQSVLQQIDGETPGKPWSDKLELSKPIIESRIKKIKTMDVTPPVRPSNLAYKSDVGSL